MKTIFTFTLIIVLSVLSPLANSSKEQPHKHSETDTEHKHSENIKENGTHSHEEALASKVSISTDIEQSLNIQIEKARIRPIFKRIRLFGKITIASEHISHVKTRFSGVIKQVKTHVGESIQAGDKLAVIESNASLRDYILRAPISGIVVQRHANVGEFTQDNVLFSIVDLSTVWAELRIFPKDRAWVKSNQEIELFINNRAVKGVIAHIVPSLQQNYVIARVKLKNTENKIMPNDRVTAKLEIETSAAALSIKKNALHSIDGVNGVFVKENEDYVFTPVQIGKESANYVQIKAGITANTEYATKNSFILKTDLEALEVSHSH